MDALDGLCQGCCVSTEPMFFARPEGTPIELRIPSRLASWNVAGHADQLRLTASLDGADELLTPTLNQLTGSVSHSRRPVRKILDGHCQVPVPA